MQDSLLPTLCLLDSSSTCVATVALGQTDRSVTSVQCGLSVLPKDTTDWERAGLETPTFQSLDNLLYILGYSLLGCISTVGKS